MEKLMNYNYVFFDERDSYKKIARYDLNSLSGCVIRENGQLASDNNLLNFLFRFHTSRRVNNVFRIPYQSIWSRKCIGQLGFEDVNKPICFVFAVSLSRYYDMSFFDYIKNHYENCKIVLILRDIVNIYLSGIPGGSVEKLYRVFDEIYTINEYDVIKYGFKPINVMCSQYPIKEDESIPHSDVVFIGKVKDRLETINYIYAELTNKGLICDFTLLRDEGQLNVMSGIRVIDKPMEYEEMLRRTIRAKCILEVTQKSISSMSSRCLEALCYNKKLITDVKSVERLKYYDPRYIQVFDSPEEIDVDFIKRTEKVDYHYDGYYSPINLLKKIDADLSALK